MPIINRKNSNKHNVVTNVTPATSAKASVTVNFPWNVLQSEPYASQGYLTTLPTPFLGIQDINLNRVNILIDPTVSYNPSGNLELIDGVNFARIGTQGDDLSLSSFHNIFLQRFVTVFNNVKTQLSLKITASLTPNTNILVFEHSNSSLGSSSNSHQIITGFDNSITLQYLLIIHTNTSVNNTYVLGSDEIYNTTFDYLQKDQKSGSVTISPKNKIKTLKRTIFPKKSKHSKLTRENLNISFDDNKSVNFLSELINSNTRLSQNSNLNNLLVSSPNTFDLNFSNKQKINNPSFVDYYLEDFQQETNAVDSFNESTCFYENKEEGSSAEEEIEINLNFNVPAILSNNRSKSPPEAAQDGIINQIYERSQRLSFPIKVENSSIQEAIETKRHTAPTAYYNFEENRWDYVGNIKRPSYLEMSSTFPSYEISDPNADSQEGFDREVDSYEAFTEIVDTDEKIVSFLKNNNICFSGVTNDYSLNVFRSESSGLETPQFFDIVNKHTGSVGSPIGNFGFPFAEKYEPLDNHIINLKDYINKDFSLKKVVFDGEFSCYLPGKASLEVAETIDADEIEAGFRYRIVSVGDTDFTLIGSSDNVVKLTFTATGPGTGSGTVEKISTGGRRIGINNVSFFLVNNRKNLNDSYFDNLESQQNSSVSWDETSLNDQNEYTRLSIKNFPENENTKFGITDGNGSIRKFSYFNTEDSITDQETENGVLVNNLIYGAHIQSGSITAFNKPSQRDLITYNNIVNFCSGSINENSKYFCLDYEKVKKDADEFVELEPYHSNSFDTVENDYDNSSSYYKRNIQIVSNVKTGTKQNDFSIYSYFPTLLSNKHGKRTLYDYNSGRSAGESYIADADDFYTSSFVINPSMLTTDQNNLTIESKSFNQSFIEDEYVLKPEDTVFLGVSLTNSFNNYKSLNENLGDDVFIIHSLKIKLIGSYKQNEKNKSSYGYLNNNSNIKHSVIGDNDLFDELESIPYQLLSNYYTRKYDKHGIDSSYTNNGQKINTTGIFFSSFNTNESLYDSRMNNILDVIEVDNKKIIDSDWPEMSNYSGASNLTGYLVTVPQNYTDPTIYDNNVRVSSYPYEDKYNDLEKPLNVDYNTLGLKGIADTLGTQTVGVLPKIFPDNPLFYDFNNNANNYFYSFNRKNSNNTRMPIAFKTSGVDPSWSWFNNEYDFDIDGFRYGVLNPNSSYNTISYSNKKYGNFSDKINRNLNYVTIGEEGDVNYTVLKNFFIDYVPVQDISTLSNTYNKDKYSRFATPFIDRSAADLV